VAVRRPRVWVVRGGRPRGLGRILIPLALVAVFGVLLSMQDDIGQLELRGPGTGTVGGVLFSVPMTEKAVALTFDDGPSPHLTRHLVLLLARYSARCTFFPIGREVERYPGITRQVVAAGHEVGSHTYSHVYFRRSEEKRLAAELLACEEIYARELRLAPGLFRFPGLAYDDGLVAAARARGYTVVSCSVDSYDWIIKDAERMARRVITMVRPGDIILMHDGNWLNPETTLTAVELILQDLGPRLPLRDGERTHRHRRKPGRRTGARREAIGGRQKHSPPPGPRRRRGAHRGLDVAQTRPDERFGDCEGF